MKIFPTTFQTSSALMQNTAVLKIPRKIITTLKYFPYHTKFFFFFQMMSVFNVRQRNFVQDSFLQKVIDGCFWKKKKNHYNLKIYNFKDRYILNGFQKNEMCQGQDGFCPVPIQEEKDTAMPSILDSCWPNIVSLLTIMRSPTSF